MPKTKTSGLKPGQMAPASGTVRGSGATWGPGQRSDHCQRQATATYQEVWQLIQAGRS